MLSCYSHIQIVIGWLGMPRLLLVDPLTLRHSFPFWTYKSVPAVGSSLHLRHLKPFLLSFRTIKQEQEQSFHGTTLVSFGFLETKVP